jgi:hypothetical protein
VETVASSLHDRLVDGPYHYSNPVPYESQDLKLDKNYGLDLKLLHWYEPGESYYVCASRRQVAGKPYLTLSHSAGQILLPQLFQIISQGTMSLPSEGQFIGASWLANLLRRSGRVQVVGK